MNTWEFTRLIEKLHSGEISELPIEETASNPAGIKEASHTADTQPVKTAWDSGEVSRELPATPGGHIDIHFTVQVPPPRSPPAAEVDD